MRRTICITAFALAFLFLGFNIAHGQTLGTAFTYQGQLKDSGQPANGNYNFDFRIFSAQNGGIQIGPSLSFNNESVTDGLFTFELDFSPAAFNDNTTPDRRWLQIAINGTVLQSRQLLTAVPYSIQTRGLDVVEDGGGMRVGVGRAGIDTFNVYRNTTGFGGMRVETNATGSPFYGYKSGNNTSVYHYLNYDSQSWRLYNGANKIVANAGIDGFVGINRSDRLEGVPSEIFGIYDATSGLGGMIIETDANGEPYYGYGNDGDLKAYHYYDDNDFEWKIKFAGTPVALTINSLGNLDIGGTAHKPGGGSWSNSSDRRLKKNIQDLESSLEKLLKIRGVTYEYLDPKAINELEGERIGVIAQELEEVFPDWVDEGSNGYKAVTFRGFEAVAVEAIRELRNEKNTQIKMLEKANVELQGENDELRDRLEMLELQVQRLVESMQPELR